SAGSCRLSARESSAPRIAYSVTCAPLRSTSSHVPRPDDRDGTDERAKITAAQTTTGPQSANFRIGGHDRLVSDRRAVRESGVNPGRSRRCEGRRSPPKCHWPAGREGGGGGSPESEDLPPALNPNPSRKEASCQGDSSFSSSRQRRPWCSSPSRWRPYACTCASR